MARLPQVGGDSGDWGVILNDFLSQSLSSDGSLKSGIVSSSQLATGAVTNASVAPNTLTEDKLAPAVQTKLNTGAPVADGTITEAKLSSALATKINTAPTIPVSSVNTLTGDVVIDKSDIGLSNVDNTSDLNKPISTSTQTALTTKITNPMTTSGDLVVGGASGNPVRLPSSAAANRVLGVSSVGGSPAWTQVPLDSAVLGVLPVANGGSGRATASTAYGILAAGTSATGIQQTIAPGTNGYFLKSAGASALASFAQITQSDIQNLTSDLAAKEPTISAGTTSQYWRGDKSWQTLNKASVGLSSVDNVSVTTYGMGVVVHGPTASTARPNGFAVITWIGSVTPTNALTNDIWVYKA